MKSISFTRFIPGIAWFFIVLILLCLPGDDLPGTGWFDELYFDKWVHAGIFGLLAYLFMFPIGKTHIDIAAKLRYFLLVAFIISAWGLATEFIQKYLVTGRSFDLLDWAADSLGAIIAFFICKKKYT